MARTRKSGKALQASLQHGSKVTVQHNGGKYSTMDDRKESAHRVMMRDCINKLGSRR